MGRRKSRKNHSALVNKGIDEDISEKTSKVSTSRTKHQDSKTRKTSSAATRHGRTRRKASMGKKNYAESSNSDGSESDYVANNDSETDPDDNAHDDKSSDEEQVISKRSNARGYQARKSQSKCFKEDNIILKNEEHEKPGENCSFSKNISSDPTNYFHDLPGRPNLSESESSDSEMEHLSNTENVPKLLAKIGKAEEKNNAVNFTGEKFQGSRLDNLQIKNKFESKNAPRIFEYKDSVKTDVANFDKCENKMSVDGKNFLEKSENKKENQQNVNADKSEKVKSPKKRKRQITKEESVKMKKESAELPVSGMSEDIDLALENMVLPKGFKLDQLNFEDMSDDTDNENWEDVDEAAVVETKSPKKDTKTKQKDSSDVQISLRVSNIHLEKRRRRQEQYRLYIERAVRRFQREIQVNVHKVHLMCLVANMRYMNVCCNRDVAKAVCLSLIPDYLIDVPIKKFNLFQLTRFTNWFKESCSDGTSSQSLFLFASKNNLYSSLLQSVQVLVCMLRGLGLLTRLVLSLQPKSPKLNAQNKTQKESTKKTNKGKAKNKAAVSQPKKTAKEKSKRKSVTTVGNKEKKRVDINKDERSDYFTSTPSAQKKVSQSDKRKIAREELQTDLKEKTKVMTKRSERSVKRDKKLIGKDETPIVATPIDSSNSSSKKKERMVKTKPGDASLKRNEKNEKQKPEKGISIKESESVKTGKKASSDAGKLKKTQMQKKSRLSAKKRPQRKRRKVSYADAGSNSDENDTSSDEYKQEVSEEDNDSDDFEKSPEFRTPTEKAKEHWRDSKDAINKRLLDVISDDAAFETSSKPLRKNKIVPRQNAEVISSDSNEDLSCNLNPKGIDAWIEVFLLAEEKWICVELNSWSLNRPENCEKYATQPVQYILGIDNDGAIKDITCRYASKWLSQTRKQRIDRDWWQATLQPYQSKDLQLNEKEDKHLTAALSKQPMPTVLSDFKSHPLYALQRHLLKFEAIYPEKAAPLGYFRTEAIYSRECVYTLHSRESWIKEARVVRKGETPYKIVKGRPKKNTPTHERDNIKLELFGVWQTEEYKPPPAKNGKVPRNEYGNVELFKPCMLPPGTVHVPIQGILKVAKKLNIDAAPAMIGWEAHKGYSVPTFEGVIVCKEYEDKLLDGWNRMEEEAEKKRKEKREKRVYDRWKLLIRGLLVREKLKRKYAFAEAEEDVISDPAPKRTKEDEDYTNTSVSWPQNRMQGKTTLDSDGHCHIFPKTNHKQDPITGLWTKSCACGLTLPLQKP